MTPAARRSPIVPPRWSWPGYHRGVGVDERSRIHRDTLAVLLTILGGVAWLVVPLALALGDSASVVPVATVLGAGLGAALVAIDQGRAAPMTAAVAAGLAFLAVRGALMLWGEVPVRALDGGDALVAGGGAAAAALGAMARQAWLRLPVAALVAGLVGLAVAIGLLVLVGAAVDQAGLPLSWFWLAVLAVLVAPAAGGAAVAVLLPERRASHVLVGWLWLAVLAGVAIGVVAGRFDVFGAALCAATATATFAALPGVIGWLAADRLLARRGPPPVIPTAHVRG